MSPLNKATKREIELTTSWRLPLRNERIDRVMSAQGHEGPETASAVIEGLVMRAAGGDRHAQNELLFHYWPVIRQVVRAYRLRAGVVLPRREQTEDLEQEVAIELLSALPNQRWQGRKAFAAWLRKIATARVVDVQRFHRAQKRDAARDAPIEKAPPASARSPESRIDESRRLEALSVLLDELKPQHAGAVMLHHLGYSHAEIGEFLQCSAEAARKLVSRGEAKLVRLTSEMEKTEPP